MGAKGRKRLVPQRPKASKGGRVAEVATRPRRVLVDQTVKPRAVEQVPELDMFGVPLYSEHRPAGVARDVVRPEDWPSPCPDCGVEKGPLSMGHTWWCNYWDATDEIPF